ncbi:hypothetical protein V6N11_050158 [Hibiscus sabdariffa]|uniref:Uncharacterized protein n=2 Tax=Hibiscus sabdariffa TaxID=183260 RepID=A0ABR2T9Q5_9ROSI
MPLLFGRPPNIITGFDPMVHGTTAGLVAASLEEQMELDSASIHHVVIAPITEPKEAQVAAKLTAFCPTGNVALLSVAPSDHGLVSRVAIDESFFSKNSDVGAVQGVVPSINKEVRHDGVVYSSWMTGTEGLQTTSKVPAKDTVVVVPSSLQLDKHVVRVVEEGFKRVLKENNGRSLYGSIRIASAKGVSHSLATSVNLNLKNSKLKRNVGSKHVVTDWAANLSADLSKVGSSMTYLG